MKIYLVGGAVRDQLLHLEVLEKDYVVVGATVEEMLAKGYKACGKDFPVFLHPKTHEEYALARTERKISKGYHGFSFYAAPHVTLEEDLKRRDLTINAMALDSNGQLIDPFNGQKDLQDKILRHVSAAFAEDPVRILRVARFYARYYHLGFKIAPETILLMQEIVKKREVEALVAERVWQETLKALKERNPEKFFEALNICGALVKIFPELFNLFGVPQNPKHHPEIDTGIHTLMVLKAATNLTNDLEVRFAALCHDFGKGLTPKQQWPFHKGHEKAGLVLVNALCDRYKVPKTYKQLALAVTEYHGEIHQCINFNPSKLIDLIEKLDGYRRPLRFNKILLTCQADSQGRTGFETMPYPQKKFLTKILKATQKIDTTSLINQGIKGQDLAQAIWQQRIDIAAKLITTSKKSDNAS